MPVNIFEVDTVQTSLTLNVLMWGSLMPS